MSVTEFVLFASEGRMERGRIDYFKSVVMAAMVSHILWCGQRVFCGPATAGVQGWCFRCRDGYYRGSFQRFPAAGSVRGGNVLWLAGRSASSFAERSSENLGFCNSFLSVAVGVERKGVGSRAFACELFAICSGFCWRWIISWRVGVGCGTHADDSWLVPGSALCGGLVGCVRATVHAAVCAVAKKN